MKAGSMLDDLRFIRTGNWSSTLKIPKRMYIHL